MRLTTRMTTAPHTRTPHPTHSIATVAIRLSRYATRICVCRSSYALRTKEQPLSHTPQSHGHEHKHPEPVLPIGAQLTRDSAYIESVVFWACVRILHRSPFFENVLLSHIFLSSRNHAAIDA